MLARQLMDKSGDGALMPDEKAELDGYVNIANVLSVMHSQARAALRRSGFEPLRDTHRQGVGAGRTQHGEDSGLQNLALAWLHCNRHMGPNIAGNVVALFHPRRDRWGDKARHECRPGRQSARATLGPGFSKYRNASGLSRRSRYWSEQASR
jgi:hypothetical protein